MFTSTSALFGWAIITLACLVQGLPTATSQELLCNLTSPLLPRDGPSMCHIDKAHSPTVAEWKWALDAYCDWHTPIKITSDSPLVYTYQLTAFDKKPIKWVFKIWIDGNVRGGLGRAGDTTIYSFPLSRELCKKKFNALVAGDAVCQAGSQRLFLGGKSRDWVVKGYVGQAVWETRQRKGD